MCFVKCNPINPRTKGKKKLIDPGKKEVKFILKKELNDTSKTLKAKREIPIYK